MRIVGLPIVGMVLLGAIALKAGTAASRPPAIEPSPHQTAPGSGLPQDTLTKADKLEIAYERKVIPVEPTRFAKRSPHCLCLQRCARLLAAIGITQIR